MDYEQKQIHLAKQVRKRLDFPAENTALLNNFALLDGICLLVQMLKCFKPGHQITNLIQ